jgi:predicted nuclease of predicted toxin-antitoxin system
MRILLDESLPQELQDELPGHSVLTVRENGWSGLKNGELLRRAADQLDVFVNADQNLQFQQNLSKLPIAVLVLVAPSNRMEALRPLLPKLLSALIALQPCTLVRVAR